MTNYRRRRRPKRDIGPRYVTNEYIRHDEMRLIGEEGNFIGIMSKVDALKLAENNEMDLVEINPKANPPVVKMMDFNKFKYQQSKHNQKPKEDKIKTVRVSVRIGPHDLAVQAKKVDEFLGKGMKVKLQVQMKGREKAHPEVSEEVIWQFIKAITTEFKYLQEPKLISDSYFATVQALNPVIAASNGKDEGDEDEDDIEESDE